MKKNILAFLIGLVIMSFVVGAATLLVNLSFRTDWLRYIPEVLAGIVIILAIVVVSFALGYSILDIIKNNKQEEDNEEYYSRHTLSLKGYDIVVPLHRHLMLEGYKRDFPDFYEYYEHIYTKGDVSLCTTYNSNEKGDSLVLIFIGEEIKEFVLTIPRNLPPKMYHAYLEIIEYQLKLLEEKK